MVVKLDHARVAEVAVRRQRRPYDPARFAVARLVDVAPRVEEAFALVGALIACGGLLVLVLRWVDEPGILPGNVRHHNLSHPR